MTRRRRLATAVALACAAAAAGCGIGPGPASEGTAYLTVTRDYGAKRLLQASVEDPPESETVLRLLDREADVTTRYGGGFVQSIEGVEGATSGSRSFDWFFYVNGIESPVGAADVRVYGGDRVWWDYREWTAAMRVPAVVGSWPEPFVHGSEGKAFPVRVDCYGADDDCSAVADRLEDEGVAASVGAPGARTEGDLLRVVVGTWDEVRADSAAAQIEDGPATSGVFADLEPAGEGSYDLVALDAGGEEADRLGPGTGLVAAVREGEEQPTWVVTGTDESGVQAAVELLDADSLRDRYALAINKGSEMPLPAP
ncbi:MAG TPA: DUF4430 domain-containing protein [Solirubrobacterales bacterium]|nr:DUF4430 domain-containing protein [Solirubrobacterales bacterium]